VLVLEFQKFKTALVVAGIIPFGVFGAVLALALTGYSLSFTATIGLIALIGIEIKNSILLVDFTEQLRRDGMGLHDAIEKAGEVRFFADMTPDQERELLESTLADIEEGPAKVDALVAAWAAGDQPEIERQMVDEMQRDYPDVYQLLLVERNKDWAGQLKTKLAGSGVSFVAVGAGHLAGPDSVQAQLAKLGIKAEVVE
jgi:pheromone shutdown protein TraB